MIDNIEASAYHKVLVGIGSNVGDRKGYIEKAMELIREIPETRILRSSDPAEYPAEESAEAQPFFLNAVLEIETDLFPLDFLEKLQIIERKLGRMSKGDGAPRPIDLDILCYDGDVVILGKTLTIPHPRLHLRRFVLEPIARLAPEWIHPQLKKTAQELLELLPRDENHPVGPGT